MALIAAYLNAGFILVVTVVSVAVKQHVYLLNSLTKGTKFLFGSSFKGAGLPQLYDFHQAAEFKRKKPGRKREKKKGQ